MIIQDLLSLSILVVKYANGLLEKGVGAIELAIFASTKHHVPSLRLETHVLERFEFVLVGLNLLLLLFKGLEMEASVI